MKRIIATLALIASLAFVGSAAAGSVGGNLFYGSNGAPASGVTVYLEQQVNNNWQIKCQGTFDQFYNFSAPWGYSPCGAQEGYLTRTEAAKYLWPSGFICRGWSSSFFWSSTAGQARNIYLTNC